MKRMERKKKIKVAIVVLAVLLCISLLALGGTLVYNRLIADKPGTVLVPDNLITPDDAATAPEGTTLPDGNSETKKKTEAGGTGSTVGSSGVTQINAAGRTAATIELYSRHSEENIPFKVMNMFPGDRETKYFRVRVSYCNEVTVHYRAFVRPGYEKLAEVMKVRIRLLNTGEIMYDGLMRDMPESVKYKLVSPKKDTAELYYEITAYLDTSVGNEYQNKELIADFKWWVEDKDAGNLVIPPNTGETFNLRLWGGLALISGCVLIFLAVTRRRKEEEENV